MIKRENKSFKEYTQRWRDLAAQVPPPMVKREMVTMMVDTLPIFYYEKLVGYMPSSFADLVFVGERIEAGLKRGKFDYVSLVGASGRRTGIAKAKKKVGDAHTVTSTPAWPKPPQTPHGTHQYAQHHPSFQLVPGPLPIQRSPNQGCPRPHREGLFRLRLRPNLTRPTMLTLAQAPTRRGTIRQDRLRFLPRSQ